LGHFSFECPNKRNDQAEPSKRQKSLYERMCFGCKEKDNNIVDYLKEEASNQVCQNRTIRFGKPEYPVSAEKIRTSGQCNKYFKAAFDKHISKNESTKRQSKNKASRIKYQTCYTCHDKGHLNKECPKTQTFIHKIVNDNISHSGPKMTLAL
jgi:hypothetical protein